MKYLALTVLIWAWLPLASAGVIFADDFNRSDGVIGNGWSTTSGNVGGDLVISNGRVTKTDGVGGVGGIYRSLSFNQALSFHGVITDMVANNDRHSRFGSRFSVLGDGSINSGYGLYFARSRDGNTDSHVEIYDGSTYLGLVFPPFQFVSELVIDFTLNTDGSAIGSVSEGGNVFNFSFGSYAYTSAGNQFVYQQSYQDPRASFVQNTTLDNLEIASGSSPVSIPGSGLLMLLVAPLLRRFKTL